MRNTISPERVRRFYALQEVQGSLTGYEHAHHRAGCFALCGAPPGLPIVASVTVQTVSPYTDTTGHYGTFPVQGELVDPDATR